MRLPRIRGRRWPVVVLLLLGLTIVLARIVALSLFALAAPTKPVPAVNYQENQFLTYNVVTKAKTACLTMLQTGTGRGTIELSEAEVNALLSQGFSQGLTGEYRLLGSRTRFLNNLIYINTALEWRGHVLGPELVIKAQTVNGDIVFILEQARIGRLPLPAALLLRHLSVQLPQGFALVQQPVSLSYDPDVLLREVNLPLIRDPRLSIEDLSLPDHKLNLTARLSFRLGL